MKPQNQQPGKGNQNGGDDSVMIIDSDDEAPAAPAGPFVDKPEFEDEGNAEQGGYVEITQTLELALGTDVFHVAVLPMAPCAADDAAWGGANILKEKMVFAISCATNDVYLVTIPLTPPSHESKARPELRKDLLAGNAGNGKWGEKLISLGGQGKSSDGIAITMVKQRSQSSERSKSAERISTTAPATRVVVAAHSREASGTLRLWDVSLDQRRKYTHALEPFQTEYLPSPLTKVAFNPTHLSQLLTIASPHAVRIYDYSLPSIPSDDTSDGPFPSQGSWLLSLYPPFARGSAPSTSRRPIVGAQWISHGRAILTLLADGQWGIWDIDGAGPSSGSGNSGGLFGRQGAGIRGAALTAFSASGYLEGIGPLRNSGGPRASTASGELAHIAHNRRESLTSAFSGSPERLATVRGGVEVVQLPVLRGGTGAGAGDESAVLWLSGADSLVSVIPVISRFWDAQVRRSAGGGPNVFSGTQPTRMVRLTELNAGLLGERCCGVGAVARFQQSQLTSNVDSTGGSYVGAGLPIEIVIRAESRLVIVHETEDGEATPLRLPRKLKRLVPANAPVEPVTAIVVHPRPNQPPAASFDLSVSRTGTLRGQNGRKGSRAPSVSLFGKSTAHPSSMDVEPFDPEPTGPMSLPSRPRTMGLDFANDLDDAADAPYDLDAEDRDIEQEVMDIMELDQALEELEEERNTGTKRVFFEEG